MRHFSHAPGMGIVFSREFLAVLAVRLRSSLFILTALLLLAMLPWSAAQAQSAANGGTLWNGATFACYSCHSASPGVPQLNAANNANALNNAISNNFGGAMGAFKHSAVEGTNGASPLSATQRADIAAYLAQTLAASFPASVSVGYQQSSTAIPLKIANVTAYNDITGISYSTPSSGSVANTTSASYSSAMGSPLTEYQAVYTHTASNCSADSFTAQGTGPGGTTSARTVNITVTPPSSPTASTAGPISASYNTAKSIPITLGGGPTASIEIVTGLSNGGSLVANGTSTFTYTSPSGSYSASDSFVYRAVGPCGATSSNVTVNINISAPPAPVITSANTASGNGGQAFSHQITANNLPTSFSITAGSLPTGVILNGSTGLISGTPTQTGSFPVTVRASNSSGNGTQSLTITINTVTPVVTSPITASGNGGQAFSYQITANNLPTSFGISAGSLPTGITLDGASGLISGTPSVTGSFPVTVTASNAAGTGSRAVTITISAVAPVITSGTTASGNGGQPFSYQITANNLPSTFAITAGALPTGVTLSPTSGLISGTPTQTGSFPVTIQATNGAGSGSQGLTITITLLAPAITSAATANGNGGQAFSYQITASNLPSSFAITSGALPTGVTLNTSNGLISGTPTVIGSFPLTIQATNGAGSGSQGLNITIIAVTPVVTSAAAAPATYGVAFNHQITASNLPTSFGATGLPPGLTLNAATGQISGTPTASGSYPVAVTATNTAGTGNQTLTIAVGAVAPGTGNIANAAVAFNTATPITLPVTGEFTQITITGAPAHGSVPTPAPGVKNVTFTPTTGYFGADTFTYSATGPGGTSTGTVGITVGTLAPTAGATTMTVQLNTRTTLDLAPFIAGSAITGVQITANAAHGTVTANGTQVIYTPAANFFGSDAFSYVAFGNVGTSPAAVVTVNVVGRPDPTKDPAVTGILRSQADMAKRVTTAQISNFQSRMESLHRAPTPLAPSGNGTDNTGNTAGAGAGAGAAGFASRPAGMSLGGAAQGAAQNAAAALGGSAPAAQTAQGSAAAYQPAASLSSHPAAGMNASAASVPGNPLAAVVNALSAGSNGQSASDPAATVGKALSFAAQTLASSTLNLSSSSGTPSLPGGTDVWIGGGIHFGTKGQAGSADREKFSSDGISAGVDRRYSEDLALGIGLGWARGSNEIGNDGTVNRTRGLSVAAYGSYQPFDNVYFDGLLGFGRLNYHSDRWVPAAGTFARAERSGDFVFGSLTAGYEFRMPGFDISPYGRMDLAMHRLHAGVETGAGLNNLAYDKQNIPSTQLSLGLRASSAHETSFGWIAPRMRAEWQHDFKGEQEARISYADQLGSQVYTLASTTNSRNAIVVGLGADLHLRRGLVLAVDYQMQRASNEENSHAVFVKLSKDLDGRGIAMPQFAPAGKGGLGLFVEAGYLHDDNVNRAADGQELSDNAYSINVSRRFLFPLNEQMRLMATGFVGADRYHNYTGLGRFFGGVESELQYRSKGDFGTPTYALFANLTGEDFISSLRDGHRFSTGISVRKDVTDRIGLFGALAKNFRNARSAVYSGEDYSARMNLDYALGGDSTLYLSGEYRYGDVFSVGRSTLSNISIAKVLVPDDVFARPQLFGYRFDGRTVLFTLGYNLPFGGRDSLDISWRRIQTTSADTPSFAGASRLRYTDNQFSIVYMTSF